MYRCFLICVLVACLGGLSGCGEKEPDQPPRDPKGAFNRIPVKDKKK